MITIVIEYNKYVRSLPQLINNTYYKTEYFVKALGISQPFSFTIYPIKQIYVK